MAQLATAATTAEEHSNKKNIPHALRWVANNSQQL